MNFIDLLLIVILVLGAGYGVVRGAISQLTGIISIWLGLIIALWLYKPFSVIILGGILEEKTKKRKKSLDEMLDKMDKGLSFSIVGALGGGIVGIAVTAIWLSVALALMQYLLNAGIGSHTLRIEVARSTLMPYFSLVLSWIYVSIKWFIPRELPAIFAALL